MKEQGKEPVAKKEY